MNQKDYDIMHASNSFVTESFKSGVYIYALQTLPTGTNKLEK